MSSATLANLPPRSYSAARWVARAAAFGTLFGLLLLGGCAMGPARAPGGPPVEDRSTVAGAGHEAPVSAAPPGGAVVAPAEVLPTPQATPLGEPQPGASLEAEPVGPTTSIATPPPGASSSKSGAVVALLDNAGAQSQAGRLESAAASLERALRIEPDNADIWYRLAVIRLLQGQDSQAEQMAMKSNALAGTDASLRGRNWHLIAEARRRHGDAAGAQAAEAEAQRFGR